MSNNIPRCTWPYNTIHIDFEPDNSIEFSPCCWWRDKKGPYTLSGPSSIQEYLDWPDYLRLKKDFADAPDDRLPNNCHYCRDYEDSGIQSLRQVGCSNKFFVDQVKYININFFDNQCNMGCYMCEPHTSSYLGNEYVKLTWLKETPKVDHSTELIDMLKSLTGDYVINVLGGEPLVSKRFADLMELVIERNWGISIISNLSVTNTKAAELMTRARYSKVIASMDGVEEFYPIMRYPFSWETFNRNLQYYKDTIQELKITVTLQALNVENLVDTINYCRDQDVVFRVSTVRSRPWLDWSILTDSEVQGIKSSLISKVPQLKRKSLDFPQVQSIIADIEKRSFNAAARDEFVNKITAIWKIRNINPEIIKKLMPWAPELQEKIING